MQEFLIEWWPTHLNANHPTGPTAIAEMRLVVQAQTANDQMAIYNAFNYSHRRTRRRSARRWRVRAAR